YRPEVHVSHKTSAGRWQITITGRIDGLSVDRTQQRVSVEEVKSIHFDRELEALYRSEKLQRHLYQLLLYSLFLSLRPEYAGFDFAPQLVLIDLATGETKTIDADFDREAVAATLAASLATLVEQLESAHALRVAKRAFASAVEFPYQRMRPYQKEMIGAVARA